MDIQQALQLANEAVFAQRGTYLTDLEKSAFYGAWEGLTYQAMGDDDRFHYAEKTLKDAGSGLWRTLSQAFGEEVKKTNFKFALERRLILYGNEKTQHRLNEYSHEYSLDEQLSELIACLYQVRCLLNLSRKG
jgi:hypothetical protein